MKRYSKKDIKEICDFVLPLRDKGMKLKDIAVKAVAAGLKTPNGKPLGESNLYNFSCTFLGKKKRRTVGVTRKEMTKTAAAYSYAPIDDTNTLRSLILDAHLDAVVKVRLLQDLQK